MTLLEKRIGEQDEKTDRRLAALGKPAARTPPEQLAKVMQAWSEYRRIMAEVLRLSRQNTNVLSFDVSVHEKRRVTKDCLSALDALLETIESVPKGTRRVRASSPLRSATAIDVGAYVLVTRDRDFSNISEIPVLAVPGAGYGCNTSR
jgi:hypothetical protein